MYININTKIAFYKIEIMYVGRLPTSAVLFHFFLVCLTLKVGFL